MKIVNKLWIVIFVIGILWIYFLFISPIIFFNKTIIVPDVVGLSEENAVSVLEDLDIKYRITYIQSDNSNTIKTIPYAGIKIKSRYVLDVYVGKVFPKTYEGFIGFRYDDVIGQIEILCNDYNIELKIVYEETNEIDSGYIIDESIKSGSFLNDGDILILTISKNDSYFYMPDLVGLNIDEGIALLKDYNLNIIINYYSSPIEENIILFQSINKDKIINKSNPYDLTIYVSKGFYLDETVNPYELEEMLVFLGYDVDVKYLKSNIVSDKLVAFEVQKLYDSNVIKFILFVTE